MTQCRAPVHPSANCPTRSPLAIGAQPALTAGPAGVAVASVALAVVALAVVALGALGCGGAPTAPATAPIADSANRGAAPHAIHYARIVDLTHALHADIPVWPGALPFRKTKVVDYDQGYLLHNFEMGESVGTHVDAPVHFIQGTPSVDTIPVDKLVAPAAVIDVSAKVAANPDYQLTAADVSAWEAEHGQIPAGALVILNTGWHRRFVQPAEYNNMDENQVMHFPGFGPDSAKLLVERDVAGIGIDTLSLDHGPSADFATHRIMLEASKYQVENLANLDALPATGATVIVAVLPVRGGSQAQARVLAFVP